MATRRHVTPRCVLLMWPLEKEYCLPTLKDNGSTSQVWWFGSQSNHDTGLCGPQSYGIVYRSFFFFGAYH